MYGRVRLLYFSTNALMLELPPFSVRVAILLSSVVLFKYICWKEVRLASVHVPCGMLLLTLCVVNLFYIYQVLFYLWMYIVPLQDFASSR